MKALGYLVAKPNPALRSACPPGASAWMA